MILNYLQKKGMMKLINNRNLIIILITCTNLANVICAQVQPTQIQIAPEPTGSGARALGQSAFIAVADDATAASWNPAGLINLEKSEASFVGAWKNISIYPKSLAINRSYDEDSWSMGEINFMSFAQPLEIGNTDVVISVNYHQVYDFGFEFNKSFLGTPIIHKVLSEGAISAYSSAVGLSIPDYPTITIGASFNWYGKSILNDYVWKVNTTIYNTNLEDAEKYTETYDDFRGHNFTFGLLWDAYEKEENLLTIGFVCHTPFTADVDQEFVKINADGSVEPPDHASLDIDYPLSLGAGLNYRFTDSLSAAFDVEWKEWSQFTYSNKTWTPSDDTLALRLGCEWLTFPDIPETICALRGGVFYEPRPAWDKIVPIYGLSAGLGWTKKDKFSLDFAYQYRWGEEDLEDFDFEIREHLFVISLIKYF